MSREDFNARRIKPGIHASNTRFPVTANILVKPAPLTKNDNESYFVPAYVIRTCYVRVQ